MLYKVSGFLSYTKIETCDCPSCDGHDRGERLYGVSAVIDADSVNDAKNRAEILAQRNFDTDETDPGYDWEEGPFIELCGEDVQMRRMGQPELFQIEGL